MNSKFLRVCAVILAAGALVGSTVFAKDPAKGKGDRLDKTAGLPRYAVLNINNLTAWFRSDGLSNHSPQADNGMYFPRGTGNVIYQDGVVFGGKAFLGGFEGVGGTAAPSQIVRVGGGTYGVGTRAGYVTGSGPTAVASDPNAADVRIYRIRRDYRILKNADGTYTADLRRDAANVNEIPTTSVTDGQMEAVYQQYATDWTEWPVAKGAPFIDRNGDGIYTAPPAFGAGFTADSLMSQNLDEPGIAGVDPNSPASQVIWTVYNDLNVSQAAVFVESEPLGIEVQKTIWGYQRSDALGNLYFSKYKLINKGGVDTSATAGAQLGSFYIDSMYVCQWSDPDLGSFSDDLAGCDSALSMGFIYNGNAVDGTYRNFGLAPAAAGYDFLAGPIVASPGDTAVFDLKLRPGYRNLGMSSFAYFSAGSPYSDPPNGEAAGYASETGQWWKMLRGYAPLGTINTADVNYAFPPGAPVDPFPLSGNAGNGSGFVDGQGTVFSFAPGDRRILLNTGPFQMAPGDTQEIVVGVVAGLGSDRRSSVTVMKFNDRFVQNTYDARFQVPSPPSAPDVAIAELDGEIVLEWGSNTTAVNATEQTISNPGAYVFEGYNVYQLPASNSPRANWTRVATYDLTTDPAVVLDEQVDNASGQVLTLPVQFGSNSSITRHFSVKRDYVRDIDKIYNGQEYYFVVTSYSVSTIPGYLPAALESDPVVHTVRPQGPPPGTTPIAQAGSGLTVMHPTGIGDVPIEITVIDPTAVTGQSYTIGWNAQPDKFEALNDANPYVLSSAVVLNEAGTSVSYDVHLSSVDSLASPIVAIEFASAAGATVKNIPYTTSLGNASASGTWRSTDGTQPLTAGNVTDLVAEGLQVWVRTAVDTTAATFGITNYPYHIDRGTTRLFSAQQNYTLDDTYPIFDGLQAKIGQPVWSNPTSTSLEQDPGNTGDGMLNAASFGYTYVALLPQTTNTTTQTDLVSDLQFRFTGVRQTRPNGTFAEDTVIVSGGSIATVYSSNGATTVRLRVPFELWEVDAGTGRNRQINVVVRDRNADGLSPWGSGGAPLYIRLAGTGRAYIGAVSTPYVSDETAAGITAVPRDNPQGTWVFSPGTTSGDRPLWRTGDVTRVKVSNPSVPATEQFSFVAPTPVTYNATTAKGDVAKIGVFPNPYYAFNAAETNRFSRFVTFNYLPQKATLRIFNLAGQLVRRIDKDDPSQFLRWDLANTSNFPVASGIYVVHVDMPDLGTTKILKVAIIQEQEILNSY